ncbi:DUF979 domain-containing protein [Undibacterium pigrum]|uniref:Putative membrane protein n=1 Tax=Undibacterium pigrum TaxID=401470 RepID=A0A318J4M2_9BURK|nr:DUF979 domain-containing protein [Undibacterium pigrum]PXX42614.1 putative membrane protein [Undibacterium pigrum]
MNSLVSIDLVLYLIGIIVMLVAFMSLRDRSNPRRITTALFWFLFGFSFLFGDLMLATLGKPLTYRIVGVTVLLMAALAGANLLGMGKHNDDDRPARLQIAGKLGNRIFIPALTIPIVTVLLTVVVKDFQFADWFLLDQKNLTLTALFIACICALGLACIYTRGTPLQAVRTSRRLVDAIGWALTLPQMLAMLGGVFVAAKTGQSIQDIVKLFINPDSRMTLIIMYCTGMALFTMIMGNAFAAFPVMTAGIALPFLINQHHANPAALVAIGMFSGYCGTLMTPMAANFNIVPAALLELKDKYQVIKVQIPTALLVLACNILLIHFFVFP